MSLSAILTEAYNFFRNHVSQLAALTLPFLLIQVMLQLWLGQEMLQADLENPVFGPIHGAAMMVLLVTFSILIAALTLYLQIRSEGHDLKPLAIIKASIPFVPPLLLAGVFSGLAVLAPVMLFAAFGPFWIIGLVVSFYLFSRLAYVNFMVIVERLTPLDAIKTSFVFSGPLVLKTIAVISLYIPLSLLGGGLVKLAEAGGLPVQLIIEVAVAFLGLFVNVALYRLYMVARSTDKTES
ncbi:hypothetical protein [Shewanella sp.]|uniref:hypothetical protein n=1 Tax=Shewanella sp. TaxID=50422 RepID=UPI004053C838